MILPRIIIIFVVLAIYGSTERIKLEAKKLIRGKVLANGYSISAKSLSYCIEYCNRRKRTCDGIIFHELIKKCRLINKCSPSYQVDNSTTVVYYSRRPQIMVPGYVYDPKSESCLGLINLAGNYAEADGICKKQNAQLAIINKKKMNQMAADLLTRSRRKWGWINEENIPYEDSVKPHGVSGNDVLSQKVFTPIIVEWRNDSLRSCWGINNRGEWGQFSCKNDTMAAFCQVPEF